MDGEKKKVKLSFGYLILGLWAVLLVQQLLSAYLRPTRISYSDFKVAVAQGKVEEAAIGKTLIQGRMKDAAAVPPERRNPHSNNRHPSSHISSRNNRSNRNSRRIRQLPGRWRRGPRATEGPDGFETIRVEDPICSRSSPRAACASTAWSRAPSGATPPGG